MATHQITIDANVKKAAESIRKLRTEVRGIGQEKVEFKFDDKKLVSAIKFQKDVYAGTIKEVKKLSTALSEATSDKQAKALRTQINLLKKDLRETSVILKDMGGSEAGGGGGLLGGFGAKAVAATAVAYSIQRLLSPAFKLANLRVGLRGLGAGGNEINTAQRSGQAFGYGPEESLQHATMLRRATGGTSSLGGVQAFSRGTGIAPNEIIGAMGNLRQGGVKDPQALRTLKDLFVDAVSKGFDESRAFDVLTAVSQYTGAMAQQGGVNPQAITQIVGALMNQPFFTENAGRSMAAVQGVEGAFTRGGPTSALAYRALAGMNENQGMSPIKLLEKVGFGLTQSGGAGQEGYNAFLGQIGQVATGRKLKSGGGMGQVSEDQRAAFSVLTQRVTGTNQSLASEIVKAFLEGDQKGLQTKLMEAEKSIADRTLGTMTSMDGTMVVMGADIDAIKTDIAQKLIPILTDTYEAFQPLLMVMQKILPSAIKFGTPFGLANEGQKGVDYLMDKMGLKTTGPAPRDFLASGTGVGGGMSSAGMSTPTSKDARRAAFRPMIQKLAAAGGVDPNLIEAIIDKESAFNPNAVSSTGATGLGQFTKRTWKAYGTPDINDRSNPSLNVAAMVNYMRDLQTRYKGNVPAMLADYTGGSGGMAHIQNIMNEWIKLMKDQNKKAPVYPSRVTELSGHKKMQSE